MQEPHTDFRAGELVRVRDDVWRVKDATRYRGCQTLRVAGASAVNRGFDRTFLVPFDRPTRLRPAARPRLARTRPILLALASSVVAERQCGALSTASTARIDLHPYQLEPTLAVVRGLGTRVLLSDEVGLGKTIQAGLILCELLERGEISRALVLTPAGLREQWAAELEARFSLGVTIADAAWLRAAAAALPRGVNPWLFERVLIASFDFIKRPVVARAIETLVWDLLIIDEAHAVAGRSDRHVAAQALARRARRVVLVTATPHAGDDCAFAALGDLGRLGAVADDPLLMFRRTRADAGLHVRRHTRLIAVRPTDAERRSHRLLERYTRLVWREASRRDDNDARLAMLVLRKRALSSAASLASSIERRLAALCGDRTAPPAQPHLPFSLDDDAERDDEEPGEFLWAPGLDDRTRERAWLRRLKEAADAAAAAESKLKVLVRLIRRIREPVIVFTEYRDTLGRLELALSGLGPVAVLHGGLSPDARGSAIRAFTRGEARVLLSTDAGGEGLNLQARCRLVVNFELPWNPGRVEQRIGRVDRIGQAATVHALHLVARDTAENLVLVNLLARLGRLRAALGSRFGPKPLPEVDVARIIIGDNTLEDEAARTAQTVAASSQADDSSPVTIVPSLFAAAEREAKRSEDVRRLVRMAGLDRCGLRPRDQSGVPLVGRIRARARRCHDVNGRLARGAVVVMSGSIVDAEGVVVESQILSFHLPGFLANYSREIDSRQALQLQLQNVTDRLAAEVRRRLSTRLDDVSRALREARARIGLRDARLIQETRAPLARLLVQPGLFDRKSLRAAEARRARADLQVEELARRLAAPRIDETLSVGNTELVVAILLD